MKLTFIEHLLCTRNSLVHLIFISLFDSHYNPTKLYLTILLLLSPFCRQENRRAERLNNLSKET